MELSYSYFAFSAAFNALVSTFLGFMILFKDRKNKINRNLAWFSFGVALWSFAYILWPLSDSRFFTLLSFQLLHIPACFVSIFYLHFVVNWLDIYKKHRLIIWIGYILSFYFASFTFTTAFIADMVPKFSMRFWAVPGPLYHYYLGMFFGLVLYASYLLIKNYFTAVGVKRKQIIMILVGIGLSFIGGSTNYFLWYNINIPPYGNILASSFVIFTVYAIVRYNLLNVKMIATEGILLILNTLLVFRFLISRDSTELVVNILVLLGVLVLSFILIQNVKKEIKRRNEITALAHNLETANIRLQELDKQKTEFLSIASHQLRTPLSILKGFIELIKDGGYGKPTKGISTTLDSMNESNEHLIKLVDDFLDISRIEQGRTKFTFETNDIGMIITEVARELLPKAEDNSIKIEYNVSCGDCQAVIDKEKVYNVIYNFIDNAIKYSLDGVVRVSVEDEDGGKTVRVRDSGIGFDKKDGVNFFQKFYRGDNVKNTNVNGTGLGLYVCRKFIEAHGGHVWAHSEGIGKGSEFGFWVPMKPKAPTV